jgi:hypothetical protein
LRKGELEVELCDLYEFILGDPPIVSLSDRKFGVLLRIAQEVAVDFRSHT